jgi:hypothetical protein
MMSMVVLWWWEVVWCFARELAGRRVSREELPLRGDRRLCLSPEAGRPAGEPGRTPAEGRPADAAYTQLFFFYSNQVFFSKKNLSFAIFVCCACCFAIQNCVTHDFQGFSAIVWFSSNQKEKFFHFKF